MAEYQTWEAAALAAGQEHYEAMCLGLDRAIAVLEKRRDRTHDTNIRYALGVAIDTLKTEKRAL